MSKIQIMPNKAGQMITVSTKNPEWGSIRLASSEMAIDAASGFMKNNSKSFLVKDKVINLGKFLEAYPTAVVPGKLVTVEFLESETPAEFSKLLNKNVTHEEAIASYVKRAGADGPELTVQGERILRYTKYDAASKLFDTIVSHDNVEEVAKFNAQAKQGNANFAG